MRTAPVLNRLRHRLRPFLAVAALAALLPALAGLLCRAIWFDHHRWSAPLTYAVTVPTAVWLLAAAACFQWLRGGVRTTAAILGCAVLLAVPWSRANYLARSTPPPAHLRPLRMVFWNIAGPMVDWRTIFASIRSHQPDLIALVEAKPMSESFYDLLADCMPEYHEVHNDKGLMVLSREEVVRVDGLAVGGVMRTQQTLTSCRGTPVRCLVADIASNPVRDHRIEAIQQLILDAGAVPGRLILAGDFNTPRDATPMSPLRAAMTHAFQQAGEGFDLTWPAPFPVMAIDHIWLRGWRAVSVRTDWTHASDHAMLVADLLPVDPP